ncbi:hypothetical protein [Photobacterium sanguinicancri]|uniref:hypothetical protein n=1 Tax=Photobacterium sanguinicancri TaxID=875932 RepID=UPI0021C353AA|nr:hypothetical protein [Photobacterium sanguinicancri]
MSDRVEFKWDAPLEITDKQNGDKLLEAFPEDKLDRVKYANFLTRFLAAQGYDTENQEKHNYVLNLNSEWGSVRHTSFVAGLKTSKNTTLLSTLMLGNKTTLTIRS